MKHATGLKIGLILALAAGLAACREEEQGRPLSFEPGVYSGKKDEKLSTEQTEALRERARLQGLR
ncbi:MAG: hypothetical protein APF80_07595 [Alphaproteobacteria bacterium BRH_c36]|nr:MAG: hypothetical protein APF80_07595 [Alphaproteobacteria bacterium BRH_c36]